MQTDVAVVGLGPVGGVLVACLAAAGIDVVAIEPAAEVFPVPRAVALDDEVLRFLASVPGLPPLELVGRPRAELVDGGGRLLAAMDFDGSRNAQPGLAFFHQPSFERALRELVGDRVVLDRVVGLRQSAQLVSLSLESGDSIEARWVVGCDGASSTVRKLMGAAFPGRTLKDPWLVVDAAGPAVSDTFRYVCDPALPAVSVPVPGGHRWEYMSPGSSYSPPIPAGLTVTRAVEYTFAARTADWWRDGRVLLAGDAAHVMPPFAGQGLGAGLRDVEALWWRLVAALRGEELGSEYADARRAHVRAMTRTALLAGAVVQTRSRVGAGAVHGALRAAQHSAWFRRGGLRPRDTSLVPNTLLSVDGVERRLDELLPWGKSVELSMRGRSEVLADGAVLGVDVDGWLADFVSGRSGRVRIRPDRRAG